jgi:dTMP kinase
METRMAHRGLFLTFEGMDGSGKTTQLQRLAERLRSAGKNVVETAEPGGTAIGMKIRNLLLDSTHQELSPMAELLLYFAARAQHVDARIRPALDEGTTVLCDRFTDSTLAYQGCGRQLGTEAILELDRLVCRGLRPDVTVLLDVDIGTSLQRARSRNAASPTGETRIDDESLEFHERVRHAYIELAAAEPQRIRVVDGRASRDVVEKRIWEIVSAYV